MKYIPHKLKGEIPCHECLDRHVGCHDKCEKYNTWKTNYISQKGVLNEIMRKENLNNQYRADNHVKRANKFGKSYRNDGV